MAAVDFCHCEIERDIRNRRIIRNVHEINLVGTEVLAQLTIIKGDIVDADAAALSEKGDGTAKSGRTLFEKR